MSFETLVMIAASLLLAAGCSNDTKMAGSSPKAPPPVVEDPQPDAPPPVVTDESEGEEEEEEQGETGNDGDDAPIVLNEDVVVDSISTDDITCKLIATPSVVMTGESTTLSMTAEGDNIQSISFLYETVTELPVTKVVKPDGPLAFYAGKVTTNKGKTAKCNVVVMVKDPPNPPQCSLVAEPAVLTQGDATLLTMSLSGGPATEVLLDGVPYLAGPYTKEVSPEQTQTMTGKVTGPEGEDECSVDVTVNPPPAPTCTLNASDANIQTGTSTTLTIAVSGRATAAVIDGTEVSLNDGKKVVTPGSDGPHTYNATVSGPGGQSGCSVQVTSTTPPPEVPTCTLTANPNSIDLGDSTTLTLAYGGTVTTVVVDGSTIATPSTGMTFSKAPSDTITYKASVSNVSGTRECSASVTVIPPPPACTLSATSTQIAAGQNTTLTISSTGKFTSAKIGATEVAPVNGQLTVSPAAPATFTGTVTGPGGTGECSVAIDVVKSQAFTYGETATSPNVDFLFILDNSPSMSSIISYMQNGIIALASKGKFPANSKLAVTYALPWLIKNDGKEYQDNADSERWTSSDAQRKWGYLEPGFLRLVNKKSIQDYKAVVSSTVKNRFAIEGCENAWFAPDETNAAKQLCIEAALQISKLGGACEAGLAAYKQLLHKFGANKLFRPGSVANIIFVSDTHDPGCGTSDGNRHKKHWPTDYADMAAKTRVANPDIAGLKVHGIIPVNKACTSESLNGSSYIPYITASGGNAAHCSATNYEPILQNIIDTAKVPTDPVFTLPEPAAAVTGVKVNGQSTADYTVSGADNNIIRINGLNADTPNTIEIQYRPKT